VVGASNIACLPDVIALNMILVLLVILYLNNQEFHDFVFNVGR